MNIENTTDPVFASHFLILHPFDIWQKIINSIKQLWQAGLSFRLKKGGNCQLNVWLLVVIQTLANRNLKFSVWVSFKSLVIFIFLINFSNLSNVSKKNASSTEYKC